MKIPKQAYTIDWSLGGPSRINMDTGAGMPPISTANLKPNYMQNIEDLRHQARQLCADRGLDILPYGNGWWIAGEIAGLCQTDLEPMVQIER